MISMDVNSTTMRRVLVDTGSSVNVMYRDVFMKFGILKDQLKLVKTSLAGSTSNTIEVKDLSHYPLN